MNILQINSSLSGASGQSTQLASAFVNELRRRSAGANLTVRDLAAEPVPHLDGERFGAFITAPEKRSRAQQAVHEYSLRLIDELRAADVVVLGLPMYNFGVPSTLKAYFDHVARAGLTFRYTANGPEGLLSGKTAFVFAARGGDYAGTPRDTQTAYVRDFLRFLGIAEVEFTYAEGLHINEARRQAALSGAHDAMQRLLTPPAALAA